MRRELTIGLSNVKVIDGMTRIVLVERWEYNLTRVDSSENER